MKRKTILFNLNEYVGGGETLLVRYAHFLSASAADYSILCAFEGSWIENEAIKAGLEYCNWPIKDNSLIYNHAKIDEVRNHLKVNLDVSNGVTLFTFCMRDYVNAVLLFREAALDVKLFHGVYHPQDYEYLSSLSINKKQYQEYFKSAMRHLYRRNSVLFATKNAADEVDAKETKDLKPIIRTLPIELGAELVNVAKHPTNIRVICISRFVSFKIGAVVAFLRFAKNSRQVECTLVGHGSYEWLVKFLIWFWRISNMELHTKVSSDSLSSLVKAHNLGFAQGTSILEIARYGIPVIIAPYSRLVDVFNKNFLTLGAFGKAEEKYELGDLVCSSRAPTSPLRAAVEDVIKNYENHCLLTIEKVKKFDAKEIFLSITADIQAGATDIDKLPAISIKPPILKQFIKRLVLVNS